MQGESILMLEAYLVSVCFGFFDIWQRELQKSKQKAFREQEAVNKILGVSNSAAVYKPSIYQTVCYLYQLMIYYGNPGLTWLGLDWLLTAVHSMLQFFSSLFNLSQEITELENYEEEDLPDVTTLVR